MIGFDPHTRRSGSLVPTRRDVRVAPSSQSGQTGPDHGERGRVPVTPITSGREAERSSASSSPSSAVRSGPSALALQCDTPTPRRGLRADAVERRRYRSSYESAARPAALPVRPTLVRSA